MPEGPEIRRAADKIARALTTSRIRDVQLTVPDLKRARSKMVGARVTTVDTHGKAMPTRFDNGLTMYSHNQLYGRWYVTRRGTVPKTGRSLRVALHSETHSAWLYSATDIELLDANGVEQHPFLQKLGPDILDSQLLPSEICDRLRDQRFLRRALSALYLDQSFLAGVGNYLRSEILFVAGLRASLRPADISRAECMRLARATRTVSLRAYRQNGITVPRKLAESSKKSGERYGEYRHYVFTREGLPCRLCGTVIETHRVSGRSVFECPGCQPSK